MSAETTVEAARRVSAAIEKHAATCQSTPDDVAGVVAAGVALSDAVLAYEEALSATGWSNPIRHLGPLPLFAIAVAGPAVAPRPESRVDITVTYQVAVNAPEDLVRFTAARFGEEPPLGPIEALAVLFKSDSWDPARYPRGLVALEDVDLVITARHHRPD